VGGGTTRAETVEAEQRLRQEPVSVEEAHSMIERVLTANSVHIPASILLQIKAALGDLLGDAGAAVLYHLSKEGTKAWCLNVKKNLRLRDRDPVLVQLLEELALTNNWGRVRFVLADPASSRREVTIEDCFECDHTEFSSEPVCHFMRGVVAGAASVILGVEADALEIGCTAKGEADCRFEVRPRV